ncbi:uncharacterized protein TrAFT101_006461 [Trichoderma asperellum]|uniref:uncharacterized protein n=1 Tax=Trichoderma asperellum TaxID=101201 RepID=UPI00332EA87B|nr:hypothetical protein TrAFT101_006461 [Trichoderma asperellum]
MTRPPPPNPLPPNRNIGPTLIVITVILTAFMLLTTGLRIYTRFSLRAQGWDDYLMIIVNVLALTRMSVQVVQVSVYNNGRHRWYISESDYVNNNMLGWYAQIFLFAGVCFLKSSILFLIVRLRDEPNVRRILYAVVTGLFITNFGTIIILVAECSPPSVYWTQQGGKCWDTRIRIYAIYFTIGFGVARAASLGLVTVDLSWDYAISAIWSNLELFLGIIAANIAISRSVYAFFREDKAAASLTGYSSTNIRLGYLKQDEQRINITKETASTIARRPSASKSEESEAPLIFISHTVALSAVSSR